MPSRHAVFRRSVIAVVVTLGVIVVADAQRGWDDDTHGRDAVPDYERVFAQDVVKRLDIRLAAADWDRLVADMTDMAGAFGAAAGGLVWSLEIMRFSGREQSRQVLYDRLDLLSPGDSTELLVDLRRRTHLPVERYEIGNVDLLSDCADITIYYRPDLREPSSDIAARAGSFPAGPTRVNRSWR